MILFAIDTDNTLFLNEAIKYLSESNTFDIIKYVALNVEDVNCALIDSLIDRYMIFLDEHKIMNILSLSINNQCIVTRKYFINKFLKHHDIISSKQSSPYIIVLSKVLLDKKYVSTMFTTNKMKCGFKKLSHVKYIISVNSIIHELHNMLKNDISILCHIHDVKDAITCKLLYEKSKKSKNTTINLFFEHLPRVFNYNDYYKKYITMCNDIINHYANINAFDISYCDVNNQKYLHTLFDNLNICIDDDRVNDLLGIINILSCNPDILLTKNDDDETFLHKMIYNIYQWKKVNVYDHYNVYFVNNLERLLCIYVGLSKIIYVVHNIVGDDFFRLKSKKNISIIDILNNLTLDDVNELIGSNSILDNANNNDIYKHFVSMINNI
jgi:hypothetical protein